MEKTQSGDLYQVDYMLVDESGKHCYYQGTYSRILDENGNVAFFYGCRDVSEIVEKEKRKLEIAKDAANAANRAKTAFLFNMSHDIRTPMNAIISFTNLMAMPARFIKPFVQYLRPR